MHESVKHAKEFEARVGECLGHAIWKFLELPFLEVEFGGIYFAERNPCCTLKAKQHENNVIAAEGML